VVTANLGQITRPSDSVPRRGSSARHLTRC
jgi:hypothetical protein